MTKHDVKCKIFSANGFEQREIRRSQFFWKWILQSMYNLRCICHWFMACSFNCGSDKIKMEHDNFSFNLRPLHHPIHIPFNLVFIFHVCFIGSWSFTFVVCSREFSNTWLQLGNNFKKFRRLLGNKSVQFIFWKPFCLLPVLWENYHWFWDPSFCFHCSHRCCSLWSLQFTTSQKSKVSIKSLL